MSEEVRFEDRKKEVRNQVAWLQLWWLDRIRGLASNMAAIAQSSLRIAISVSILEFRLSALAFLIVANYVYTGGIRLVSSELSSDDKRSLSSAVSRTSINDKN